MSPSLLLRVCAASLAVSVMSFLAGLAGDFSRPLPVSGASVVLRIPPEIPADSPRAMPLPPLPRTASAMARTVSHSAPAAPHEIQPPAIVGPGAGMIRDHEIAHSAADSAYAAEDLRARLG